MILFPSKVTMWSPGGYLLFRLGQGGGSTVQPLTVSFWNCVATPTLKGSGISTRNYLRISPSPQGYCPSGNTHWFHFLLHHPNVSLDVRQRGKILDALLMKTIFWTTDSKLENSWNLAQGCVTRHHSEYKTIVSNVRPVKDIVKKV